MKYIFIAFSFIVVLTSLQSQNCSIPYGDDLEISYISVGCPGGFTEISINCPSCTCISDGFHCFDANNTNSDTTLLIPIPNPALPNSGYSFNTTISYNDGICTNYRMLEIPFINGEPLNNADLFPISYCPGASIELDTIIVFSFYDSPFIPVFGNWSGMGVSNNVFTDPNNGNSPVILTFTATNCTGFMFDQIISFDYQGFNKIQGIANNTFHYESNNPIESIQRIQSMANIEYDSAIEIELQSPFEVKTGAVFHAYIDGCDNQINQSARTRANLKILVNSYSSTN